MARKKKAGGRGGGPRASPSLSESLPGTGGTLPHNRGESNRQSPTFGARVATAIGTRVPSKLSAELGIGKNSISRYISGETLPSVDVAAAIAAATGCDPGWLLTGAGTPFPAQSADSQAGRVAAEQMAAATIDALDAIADAVEAAAPFIGRADLLEGLESRIARLLQVLTDRRGKVE